MYVLINFSKFISNILYLGIKFLQLEKIFYYLVLLYLICKMHSFTSVGSSVRALHIIYLGIDRFNDSAEFTFFAAFIMQISHHLPQDWCRKWNIFHANVCVLFNLHIELQFQKKCRHILLDQKCCEILKKQKIWQ